MPHRPRAVVFDVVQTLISLEPLRPRFAAAGLGDGMLERWFDRLIRDAMALTLTGEYVPFGEVAPEALQVVAGGNIDDDAVAGVLAGIDELPAQPDAEPALRALGDAGIAVACLSNGSEGTVRRFLGRSGLDRHVQQVMSVDDVGQWKPVAAVYEHALSRLGQPADAVALVAVHAWDCHGAGRAGMTTGWASRLEGHYSAVFHQPDVVGADLVEVVEALLELPERIRP